MRLHRFHIDDRELSPQAGVNSKFTITSPEIIHQIINVFRMKIGDQLIVFNGTGFDYECKIDNINRRSTIVSNSVISLTVLESQRNNISQVRKLFLGAAVVKKDNFEWIVEKATELGVTDIIPIAAERSEKKALNEERLRKIAVEASEQSGRDTTPMVWPIMESGSAVSLLKKENPGVKILAFHTEGNKFGSVSECHVCTDCACGQQTSRRRTDLVKGDLAVFIGPEGGWSPMEIEMFHRENVEIVCLGSQVLRAETAVVAALSVVVFG